MATDCPADPQRELLLAMTPRLRGYLHVLLGGWDGVEDVLQDVFLRYLEKGPSPHDPDAGPWLFTVARRVALNWQRSWWRRRRRERIHAQERPAAGDDPAEIAARRESHARIERCLLRLPTDLRELLYLKVVEGLSYSDVAARVDAPRSTVALRVHDALILLNRCFHGESS